MNELDCREFVEQITDFLEGALDPEAERRLADHLALCDGCDRYLAQFQQTIRSLGDLPPEGVSAQTRAALLRAFRDLSR